MLLSAIISLYLSINSSTGSSEYVVIFNLNVLNSLAKIEIYTGSGSLEFLGGLSKTSNSVFLLSQLQVTFLVYTKKKNIKVMILPKY